MVEQNIQIDSKDIFSQNVDMCLDKAAAPPRYSSVLKSLKTKKLNKKVLGEFVELVA